MTDKSDDHIDPEAVMAAWRQASVAVEEWASRVSDVLQPIAELMITYAEAYLRLCLAYKLGRILPLPWARWLAQRCPERVLYRLADRLTQL